VATRPDRPDYLTYLPPAYVDDPEGLYAGFVKLYEALMAGNREIPVRPLRASVSIDVIPPALIGAPGDVTYDTETRTFTFLGEMSHTRLAELLALGSVLSADERATYEQILTERLHPLTQGQTEAVPGLEQLLDDIARYTDPERAPGGNRPSSAEAGFFDEDFVQYLAGWVSLSVTDNWPLSKTRRLIQNIVPLYKRRGTITGIRRFLEIFVEAPVRVSEELGIQVGVRSTVERDTTVGGLPHIFQVEIPYGYREVSAPPVPIDINNLRFVASNVRTVLDEERPAHTDYTIGYNFPGIVVGHYSTAGWDTLVWPNAETIDVPRE
jgi:phage tail-like protein